MQSTGFTGAQNWSQRTSPGHHGTSHQVESESTSVAWQTLGLGYVPTSRRPKDDDVLRFFRPTLLIASWDTPKTAKTASCISEKSAFGCIWSPQITSCWSFLLHGALN